MLKKIIVYVVFFGVSIPWLIQVVLSAVEIWKSSGSSSEKAKAVFKIIGLLLLFVVVFLFFFPRFK